MTANVLRLAGLDVLEDMKNRLSDPGAWTRGAAARNKDGKSVLPSSEDACCWSLDGALVAAPEKIGRTTAVRYMKRAIYGKEDDVRMVEIWNRHENRTHGEVMQMLDRAIEAAKQGA